MTPNTPNQLIHSCQGTLPTAQPSSTRDRNTGWSGGPLSRPLAKFSARGTAAGWPDVVRDDTSPLASTASQLTRPAVHRASSSSPAPLTPPPVGQVKFHTAGARQTKSCRSPASGDAGRPRLFAAGEISARGSSERATPPRRTAASSARRLLASALLELRAILERSRAIRSADGRPEQPVSASTARCSRAAGRTQDGRRPGPRPGRTERGRASRADVRRRKAQQSPQSRTLYTARGFRGYTSQKTEATEHFRGEGVCWKDKESRIWENKDQMRDSKSSGRLS